MNGRCRTIGELLTCSFPNNQLRPLKTFSSIVAFSLPENRHPETFIATKILTEFRWFSVQMLWETSTSASISVVQKRLSKIVGRLQERYSTPVLTCLINVPSLEFKNVTRDCLSKPLGNSALTATDSIMLPYHRVIPFQFPSPNFPACRFAEISPILRLKWRWNAISRRRDGFRPAHIWSVNQK